MGLEDLFNVVKTRFNAYPAAPEGEERDRTDKPDKNDSAVKVPANIVFKCPRCLNVIMTDELEKNLRVCPECGYHARLTAPERIRLIADKESFREFDADMKSLNPIDFPDYEAKQQKLRESTGLKDAVITGECTVRGEKCVIGVMDSRYMMASMGSVVGEKITRAFEYAAEKKLPVIGFALSGGARMQEGIISLMQMAKTSGAVLRHSQAGGLYISVLTDPTTGGVSASFAFEADIIIAEPAALIGFAGPRVIEQTIRQKLPAGFQRAEFLLGKGFVDAIVDRRNLKNTLSFLLSLHAEKTAKETNDEEAAV